tara:strand:+ start:1419 stop:1757 length:339 start_codon:yes stop_codon:yes gene_type:complete
MIINVIRKPLIESVVKNIKAHECGGINIDNCRISSDGLIIRTPSEGDRFPSNLVLSKSSLPHLPQATQGHWANAKITGYGDGIGEGSVEYFGVGEKDQSGGTVAKYFFIVGD